MQCRDKFEISVTHYHSGRGRSSSWPAIYKKHSRLPIAKCCYSYSMQQLNFIKTLQRKGNGIRATDRQLSLTEMTLAKKR